MSTPSGSSGGGRNESPSVISSGVLGGLLGLIFVGFLGALIYRCGRRAGERLTESGSGTGTAGTSSTRVSDPGKVGGIAGGPSAGNWGLGLSNKHQYSAVPLTSPHAEAEPPSWGHGPGGYGYGGLWPPGGQMNMPAPDPNVATPVHVYVKFPPLSFYFGAAHVTDLVIISLFSILRYLLLRRLARTIQERPKRSPQQQDRFHRSTHQRGYAKAFMGLEALSTPTLVLLDRIIIGGSHRPRKMVGEDTMVCRKCDLDYCTCPF